VIGIQSVAESSCKNQCTGVFSYLATVLRRGLLLMGTLFIEYFGINVVASNKGLNKG